MKKLSIVFLAIILCASMCACTDKEATNAEGAQQASNSDMSTSEISQEESQCLHEYEKGVCILCDEADPDYVSPIVGTWEGKMYGMDMIYIFNEDGSFQNYVASSAARGDPGTYVYNEDTGKLVLKNTNTDGSGDITVTISGDVMVLTISLSDGSSIDVIFKRQN